MENEEKLIEDELTQNNRFTDENSSPIQYDDDDDDNDDLDWDEFVTREEFLDATDEISTQLYVLKLHLAELQKKLEETPQQLTCDTKPESAKKICTVHHALGLSPTYMLNFRKGHDSNKSAALCIYVKRPGTKKTLQYAGDIIGLPRHLAPGTSALLSSSKDKNGKITFKVIGTIEDLRPDILSILQEQQRRISALEQQVDRLTVRLEQTNASER